MIILSEADLAAVALPDGIVRAAVEAGLQAQAEGRAIAEPTSVFSPAPGRDDLIAVIRGALPDEALALVKTVGGFPGNAAKGLATNPGVLTLIETETGRVTGVLPAARITTERTAMVTAIGAMRLARPGASVLGCIGSGGIAVQAAHFIARAMKLGEIRICGRDLAKTERSAAALSEDLDLPVTAVADRSACVRDADVVIEGAALPRDVALFPAEDIIPGAVVIAYGAYSAFPAGLMAHIDRLVMDRWVDDGRGALGPLSATGDVDWRGVDALIGDVISGKITPREKSTDRILYVHRGVAACDIALAQAYLASAHNEGLGTEIPF